MSPIRRLSATFIERTEALHKFFENQPFLVKKQHRFNHDYDVHFWYIYLPEKVGPWYRKKHMKIAKLYVDSAGDYAHLEVIEVEYEQELYKFVVALKESVKTITDIKMDLYGLNE